MRPDTDYNNKVDVSIPTGSGGTIGISHDGYLWHDIGSCRSYAPITTTADGTMSGSLRDLHRQFEKLRMEYEDVRRWPVNPWALSWDLQKPMQVNIKEAHEYWEKIFDTPDDIDAKGMANGLCELFDEL